MKVAIYGDSFADPLVGNLELTRNGVNVGWPELLKEKYTVDVYARGGSSVYYSYNNFLETHHKYDKVIFVITESRRWHSLFEVNGKTNQYNDNLFPFANLFMVDSFLKNEDSKQYLTQSLKDKLVALQDYYTFLIDDCDDYNRKMAHLMIDDVLRIRKDVIMMPGFNFGRLHSIYQKTSLATFAYVWLNNWPKYRKQVSGNDYLHWHEKRTICHFSKEVNEVIAKEMAIAIQQGDWNPNIPTHIPAEHSDFGYYYHI